MPSVLTTLDDSIEGTRIGVMRRYFFEVLAVALIGGFYVAELLNVGRVGAICGPLIGGWLLSLGIAYPWGFYAFAVVAAFCEFAVSVVGAKSKSVVQHSA